jgi:chromosome segregation ATPase
MVILLVCENDQDGLNLTAPARGLASANGGNLPRQPVVGAAVHDPKRHFASANCCVAKDSFGLDGVLKAREETLAARAAKAKAAVERIAELEAKFETSLERIAFQDNENQSLQTSLDLTVSDNLRLSNRLSESDATLEKLSSELEQLKTSDAERNKLSSVVDRKIELLQNLLQVKERRIQKLEQARSKLTDDTKKLLRTCAKRDQALARAEERISSLTELFAQLETKVELASNKEELVERHSRLQREQRGSASAEGSGKMTLPKVNLWKRELDCDEWLLGRGRG